jgi:hypothetical protein
MSIINKKLHLGLGWIPTGPNTKIALQTVLVGNTVIGNGKIGAVDLADTLENENGIDMLNA